MSLALNVYTKYYLYGYCMKNNQSKIIGDRFPTKSPIELKSNSFCEIFVNS